MHEMIGIRNAEENDADDITSLLSELGYPNERSFAVEKIRIYNERATCCILVAELDDQILGFIAFDAQPLFHQEGNIGTIMALCVSQSARGKGVGGALVDEIEQVAKDMGCVKIAVASGLRRTEAHEFYQRLGYEEITKRFVKQLC